MRISRNLGVNILALILLATVLAFPASAQNVVLKLGTLAPEGTNWVKAFREINQEMEQKTNKQVTLRVFPGGILGDEEDMLRKVKVGQIQGALLTGGGLGLIFKDIKILAIPFLFQNYREVDALLGKMEGFFQKGFQDNGFKSLGWAEQGFIYVFSKEPIKKVSDIRRGKVWIWEDTAMGRAVFDELGINPIPLSIPDILMALQTGMIDTIYSSPLAAISMQWFTKVSWMTDMPLAYSAGRRGLPEIRPGEDSGFPKRNRGRNLPAEFGSPERNHPPGKRQGHPGPRRQGDQTGNSLPRRRQRISGNLYERD